jgi:polyhydroxybutyrate depolymerase
MNWTIDGVKREALVFAPKRATNDSRHPVVFAWHGHGGNMQGTSQQMHLQTVWPEAIVVYPQGLPTTSLRRIGVGQFNLRNGPVFEFEPKR